MGIAEASDELKFNTTAFNGYALNLPFETIPPQLSLHQDIGAISKFEDLQPGTFDFMQFYPLGLGHMPLYGDTNFWQKTPYIPLDPSYLAFIGKGDDNDLLRPGLDLTGTTYMNEAYNVFGLSVYARPMIYCDHPFGSCDPESLCTEYSFTFDPVRSGVRLVLNGLADHYIAYDGKQSLHAEQLLEFIFPVSDNIDLGAAFQWSRYGYLLGPELENEGLAGMLTLRMKE